MTFGYPYRPLCSGGLRCETGYFQAPQACPGATVNDSAPDVCSRLVSSDWGHPMTDWSLSGRLPVPDWTSRYDATQLRGSKQRDRMTAADIGVCVCRETQRGEETISVQLRAELSEALGVLKSAL